MTDEAKSGGFTKRMIFTTETEETDEDQKYPYEPGWKGNPYGTRHQSAKAVRFETKLQLWMAIVRILHQHGPNRVWEIARFLHIEDCYQVVKNLAPRVSELKARGILEDSGLRRLRPRLRPTMRYRLAKEWK